MRPAVALALAAGCGDDGGAGGGDACGPDGGVECAEGTEPRDCGCAPRFDDCGESEVALVGGGCRRVGPSADCWPGWAPDGDGGCEPILPESPCPDGTMPIIGETGCVPIRECGDEPWGNVAVEDGAIFVDGSYAGGDSDGTEARPFTVIQDALDEAPPGGQVIVAAGEYDGDLTIDARVRLEGRCPESVTVRGVASDGRALRVLWDEAAVRGVRVTGPGRGIVVDAAVGVSIEEVAVEDCGLPGVVVQNGADVALRRVVVAGAREFGLYVSGSYATVEDLLVADTGARADGLGGAGLWAELSSAQAAIRRAIVSRNRTAGVGLIAAVATIEESVLEDTRPQDADGFAGSGLLALDAQTTLVRSAIRRNRGAGFDQSGGSAWIEDTTVRDTIEAPAVEDGEPTTVGAGLFAAAGCDMAVATSLVAGNAQNGVVAEDCALTLADSIVRDTVPRVDDGDLGFGVVVQGGASGTIDLTLVRDTRFAGVLALGASVTVDRSRVVEIAPRETDEIWGVGVAGQIDLATGAPARLDVRGTLIDACRDAGIALLGGSGTIERILVRGTRPAGPASPFGDGIALSGALRETAVDVGYVALEDNARAGILFHDAGGSLSGSLARGNAFAVALGGGGDPEIGGDNAFCYNGRDDVVVGQNVEPPPAPFGK